MKKQKILLLSIMGVLLLSLFFGCQKSDEKLEDPGSTEKFKGEELSILVSSGWMDNRYDPTISRFEETYGVTVDLQAVPADQYEDVLQVRLLTGVASDIFWIQSNPFAIESVIIDYDKYCIDFSGSQWESIIPEARLASCKVDNKLLGLQLWHNSPEYVMLYNKTLFSELGINSVPTTYSELLDTCEILSKNDVTPWFVPGADGWQHQLAFFQIGGVYEENQPGLYKALNENKSVFSGNETMTTVLKQFKELADLGYLGEDWIGSNSSNMANQFADRSIGMAMSNSSYINQIKSETNTTDEFGLFLLPLADNNNYPTNPSGPTMFGYKDTKHEDLVRAFFDFITTTESLQEILDNSPAYTNIHVNDPAVKQHWLKEEEEFINSVPKEKMATSVLQSGTKYTNDFWMDFGSDMTAYCLSTIDVDEVLKNMDTNRAKAAEMANDPNW